MLCDEFSSLLCENMHCYEKIIVIAAVAMTLFKINIRPVLLMYIFCLLGRLFTREDDEAQF